MMRITTVMIGLTAALCSLLCGCAEPEPRYTKVYVPTVTAPHSYPYGFRTDQPGLVHSPWNPTGPLMDVRNFAPGALAQDPTTGRIFIVP